MCYFPKPYTQEWGKMQEISKIPAVLPMLDHLIMYFLLWRLHFSSHFVPKWDTYTSVMCLAFCSPDILWSNNIINSGMTKKVNLAIVMWFYNWLLKIIVFSSILWSLRNWKAVQSCLLLKVTSNNCYFWKVIWRSHLKPNWWKK